MNKRIQELAEQAGMRHPVMGEVEYACFSHEKFAELIIQACIKQCNEISLKENGIVTLPPGLQSYASYKAGALDCASRLKYYFKVKE